MLTWGVEDVTQVGDLNVECAVHILACRVLEQSDVMSLSSSVYS
jgi:hypothetical protein